MALDAIIFDVDGTLAETEEMHRRAFNAAFAAHRLPWRWDPETYLGLLPIGGGRERIRRHAEMADVARLRQTGFDALIQGVHEHKSRLYAQWIEAGALAARPGVLRLLSEARNMGLALACATSSQRSATVALLRSILGPGAEAMFSTLGCGDDVDRKKPAPDVYLGVLARLGLSPDRCIAIEDTEVGLASARAVGLPTVVALSDYSEPVEFGEAVAVVSNLGEPDRPFTLVRGDAFGRNHVDVELLRRWHAAATNTIDEPIYSARSTPWPRAR